MKSGESNTPEMNEIKAETNSVTTSINPNALNSLLTAYQVAHEQHMHEHDRSLTKLNYYLVLETVLFAAFFSQEILRWWSYAVYFVPPIGIVYSLIWLFSHQRGRACYETKLDYIEALECKLAAATGQNAVDFLFTYFKQNHSRFSGNITRRWDTEEVIKWLIVGFVVVWLLIGIALVVGLIPPPTTNIPND